MRIIAGEFRGRRLKTLPGPATRPTSDKLRETLFNVLGPAVDGAVFYDCFAGSGAVGLEALSRGAAHVVFIEKGRGATRVLRENIKALGVEGRVTVLEQAVAQALARTVRQADFVFLAPPYDDAREYDRVLSLVGDPAAPLAPGAVVIAEHARRPAPAARFGRLDRFRLLEQGSSALSFYEVAAAAGPSTVSSRG